jgi:hypothetical protein
MLTAAQTDARTDRCPAPDRSLTVRTGSRRCIAHGAGDRPTTPPVTSDRLVAEMQEVLADILACIFAEAQDMGTLEPPSQASGSFHNNQRVNE